MNIIGAQCLVSIAYWRRGTSVRPTFTSVRPTFTSVNSSVRPAYFHTNRFLTGLYKTETEIRSRKDDNEIKMQTDIDRHGPKPSSNSSQPPNFPPFSLPTTFKLVQISKISNLFFFRGRCILRGPGTRTERGSHRISA